VNNTDTCETERTDKRREEEEVVAEEGGLAKDRQA